MKRSYMKIQEKRLDIRLGHGCVNVASKVQAAKAEVSQWEHSKLERLLPQEGRIHKMTLQANQKLTFKMHEEQQKKNEKLFYNPVI